MTKHAKKVVTACLVAAVVLGLAPSRAFADWDDNSGSLGLASGKKIAIIAGAATAGVITVYLLRKHKNAKTPDPNAERQTRFSDDAVRDLRTGPLGHLWTLQSR